ncbi:hypothetical protein LAZ67_12003598 [Cordylochernes scorpioides]|uniref:Uncharacterized protein n=1 Tax=Cordylochernes scorpioides TaxID=51811 RepID=A0ABY6L3B6_9ARAC|nr:hypothetical protein LAZ67_12003598 [Cordylochernes scorpioides]
MLCIWWDQLGVAYYELLQPNERITGEQRLRLSELETEAFLPNTDLEIFLILSFKWHFDVILDFALVQRMQCLKSDGPWSNSQRLVRQLALL